MSKFYKLPARIKNRLRSAVDQISEERTSDPSEIQNLSVERSVAPGQLVQLAFETVSSASSGNNALVSFQFRDADGKEVAPINWKTISNSVGPYRYLKTEVSDKPAITAFSLEVPKTAQSLLVNGRKWNKDVQTRVISWNVEASGSDNSVTSDKQLASPSGVGAEPANVASSSVSMNLSSSYSDSLKLPEGVAKISLKVSYIPKQQKGDVPLRVAFLDSEENIVFPTADVAVHPIHGPILTLPSGSSEVKERTFELEVPKKAESVQLTGMEWGGKDAVIVGRAELEEFGATFSELDRFLDAAARDNAPLIVVDTTAPPIGHETLSLRPNNLTNSYADLGAYIIFFPFSSLQGFPSTPRDHVLQLERPYFSRVVAKIADFRGGENCHFICSSFPNFNAVTSSELLKARGWSITYEVRDDMEEFNRVGYSKWYSPSLEREMLKVADNVVSVSKALDQKLHALYPPLGTSWVVPNGVNNKVISEGRHLREVGMLQVRNESNIFGYVGHLTPSWFDWEILSAAARKTPEITYEIVGHGAPEGLNLPKNVELLGPKSHAELVDIVDRWRVGLIPFKNLPLTRSVDPNKIYEYFAWGLRCLSAPMGLVDEYPSTWVHRNVEEFVAGAREILTTEYTEEELDELKEFLHTATWDSRAITMCKIIGIEEGVELS